MKKLITISEVSRALKLVNESTKKPLNHILRYWEKEFKEISPKKINNRRFKVHRMPETLRSTNLDDLVFGDQVNLELDQNTITITDTTERLLRDKA